jgi:hypothetical protein
MFVDNRVHRSGGAGREHRFTCALPSRVRDQLEDPPGVAELDQPEEKDQEHRQHEGELDQALPPIPPTSRYMSTQPFHRSSRTVIWALRTLLNPPA